MLTMKVDEENLYNKLNNQKDIKKEKVDCFNYKGYFVWLEYLSNGIVSVSASSDDDDFKYKYIFFTKNEITKLIKEKITERVKEKNKI